MSDLREAIDRAIREHTVLEMQTHGYENCWVDDTTDATEHTIAAFAEALLQPEVVEAAAEAEHKRMWQGAYSPFTWSEEDTGIQDGIRDSTRETLKAALAAITTPAGDGTG